MNKDIFKQNTKAMLERDEKDRKLKGKWADVNIIRLQFYWLK